MKMQYVKPSAERVRFENEDVITTSGGGCSEIGICSSRGGRDYCKLIIKAAGFSIYSDSDAEQW